MFGPKIKIDVMLTPDSIYKAKTEMINFSKKASSQHKQALSKPNEQPDLVTRLKVKAEKAHEVYCSSSSETRKANQWSKLFFFTVQ